MPAVLTTVETSPFHGRVSLHSFSPGWLTSLFRRRKERLADSCVDEQDSFEGGSIMVWGGIAHGIKIKLNCCRGQ